MSTAIQQLIADVADVTGSAPPAVLAGDAPVLQDEALAASGNDQPYFVGVIGGKDVGKSALINALVGEPISASTSFGPGTETVVAYVHQTQLPVVKALLDREAPGKHQLIVHTIA